MQPFQTIYTSIDACTCICTFSKFLDLKPTSHICTCINILISIDFKFLMLYIAVIWVYIYMYKYIHTTIFLCGLHTMYNDHYSEDTMYKNVSTNVGRRPRIIQSNYTRLLQGRCLLPFLYVIIQRIHVAVLHWNLVNLSVYISMTNYYVNIRVLCHF